MTTLYTQDTLRVTLHSAEAYTEYKLKSSESRMLQSHVRWYQHSQNFGFLANAS